MIESSSLRTEGVHVPLGCGERTRRSVKAEGAGPALGASDDVLASDLSMPSQETLPHGAGRRCRYPFRVRPCGCRAAPEAAAVTSDGSHVSVFTFDSATAWVTIGRSAPLWRIYPAAGTSEARRSYRTSATVSLLFRPIALVLRPAAATATARPLEA